MTTSRDDRMRWGALAALLGVALVIAVAFIVPRFPTSYRRPACLSNAARLGQMFETARAEKRFDPALHGSAQILSWFGTGGPAQGDEVWFFCPGDVLPLPETPEESLVFHPADADAIRRARGLGSYAVRDFAKFPLVEGSTEKQPILCDRQGDDGRTMHHRDGIVVWFSDGDAQFLTREELGIRPDETIIVGPESESAVLRVFERP